MTTFADTSIPGVTAALIAGLQARAALKQVSICDGPAPANVAGRPDVIELLDAEVDWTARMDATTQPRAEDGQINVLITCQKQTRDKQTVVNARAFALLSELNQLLRGATDLQGFYTGPGFIAGARIERIKHTKRIDPQGAVREAGLDVTVIWKARI